MRSPGSGVGRAKPSINSSRCNGVDGLPGNLSPKCRSKPHIGQGNHFHVGGPGSHESWQERRNRQMVIIVCPSVPVSISRPVPVLPRSGCGPEPAAVRFKAAFRAALRPDRTDLAMAGPRPARGLRKPCLAANLPCSPSVRPDPEAPVIPPVPVVRARGRAGTEPVRASGKKRKDIS